MNDDQPIYSGDFSDSEIAVTWQIVNNHDQWRWHYHNKGGPAEDIYFRFDSKRGTAAEAMSQMDEDCGSFSFPAVISKTWGKEDIEGEYLILADLARESRMFKTVYNGTAQTIHSIRVSDEVRTVEMVRL